ncbi:YuzF family protein [Bacillus sp. 31A1R]|uniref:YuzF family protein n=1 Tax=Robertmurraya mangrovi TaxID=3098077 RepID=A0ABU5J048_9BACI|nr:YuzF family protein [Bacillus sp. 31A1R]MDZ5472766.1 YuzF family protein [Bacillus sp. 31A1R]
MNSVSPTLFSLIDPYVYQTLLTIVGREVTVQTVRGTVRGNLKTVMPDHVVVESAGTPFFIRTQQIIWVFPSTTTYKQA